jgi:DNA-binding NtrC family response regulator
MQTTIGTDHNHNAFVAQPAGTLHQQIEVLTTLAAALLGELEILHFTVAAGYTGSAPQREPSQTETPPAEFRIDFYKEVERYEIALIKRALMQSCGIQKRAAQRLAMNSTTLSAKIKHFGIQTADLSIPYSSCADGSFPELAPS